MQYTYELTAGRIGTWFNLIRRNDEGVKTKHYIGMISSKGFTISTVAEDGSTDYVVCDFDSFLYPDRIEEEEIMAQEMVTGRSNTLDRKVMRLASMLCALWSGGHSEETMYETLRTTTEKWSQ